MTSPMPGQVALRIVHVARIGAPLLASRSQHRSFVHDAVKSQKAANLQQDLGFSQIFRTIASS
jgi:hypothetical protein